MRWVVIAVSMWWHFLFLYCNWTSIYKMTYCDLQHYYIFIKLDTKSLWVYGLSRYIENKGGFMSHFQKQVYTIQSSKWPLFFFQESLDLCQKLLISQYEFFSSVIQGLEPIFWSDFWKNKTKKERKRKTEVILMWLKAAQKCTTDV